MMTALENTKKGAMPLPKKGLCPFFRQFQYSYIKRL